MTQSSQTNLALELKKINFVIYLQSLEDKTQPFVVVPAAIAVEPLQHRCLVKNKVGLFKDVYSQPSTN